MLVLDARIYVPLSPMMSSLNRWSYSRAILTHMTHAAASRKVYDVADTRSFSCCSSFSVSLSLSFSHPRARDNPFFSLMRSAFLRFGRVYATRQTVYYPRKNSSSSTTSSSLGSFGSAEDRGIKWWPCLCVAISPFIIITAGEKKAALSVQRATPIPYQIVTNLVTATMFLLRFQVNVSIPLPIFM